jgi:type VI secretion system secreted protein Hcp
MLLVVSLLLLAVPVLTQSLTDDNPEIAQRTLELKPIVAPAGEDPSPCTATGYFLKISDVDGESTDDGHKDWINLTSVSQSLSRPMAPAAGGSSRHRGSATFGDVVCVKEVDASTPKLLEACANGRVFPEVTIELCQEGQEQPYLMWELKQCRVTSYSVSGSTDGDAVPTEELSLNFEEIRYVYTEHLADGKSAGKVEAQWKVEEGES